MQPKTCTRCEKSKPRDDFQNLKASPDGKQPWCRLCHRLSPYGLTEEQYNALVSDGQCHVCGGTPEELVIDRGHRKGKVRGILCHKCSRVLGMVYEDTEISQAMIEYINGNA